MAKACAGHARGRREPGRPCRAVRGNDHAPDRIGIVSRRHEDEAVSEFRPQSIAERIDDRLVREGCELERRFFMSARELEKPKAIQAVQDRL